MREPQIEDSVELIEDHMEGGLHAGSTGVVCSVWFMPNPMYELEFQPENQDIRVRAFLSSDHFRIVEKPVS